MKFDMHTHTLYSDGLYTPESLIDLAIEKNLSGIAITDHDTLDGLDEGIIYASRKDNFVLIPGIELGCRYNNKEVHILGYFIDYKNKYLKDITIKLKESRVLRGEKMVKRLSELGLEIDIDNVRKFAKDDYIGRPHVARALIEKNYVEDIDEAFEKYLKIGAAAYVERFQLSISESIDLIHRSNGISVLAHPGLIDDWDIIDYVISLGIDGIECYHSKHSEDVTQDLLKITRKNNLIITGGSDFHGDTNLLGDYYIDFNENLELRRRIENDQ